MKIDDWFNKNKKLIGIGIIILGLQMVISGIIFTSTTIFPDITFTPPVGLNITETCTVCGFQWNTYTVMSVTEQLLSAVFGIVLIVIGNRIRK